MSSGTSTERGVTRPDDGFEVWHVFVLLAMVGATVAVMLSRNTHPAALLLLSAAVLTSGLVGLAFHRALMGLIGQHPPTTTLREDVRVGLEREKALTLRSIKELEFDRAMGKVSAKDFDDVAGRLRARALALMAELEAAPATPPVPVPSKRADATPSAQAVAPVAGFCGACGSGHDREARFCKQCGARLDSAGPDVSSETGVQG